MREQLVEFETDHITITLEWNELNPLFSVNITVIPETQVNISGSTAQLTVNYNVMYNVSVMISHFCEQNMTVFDEEYYYPHTATSEINFKFISQVIITFWLIISFSYTSLRKPKRADWYW